MKNIWIAVLIVISFVFVSQTNAEDFVMRRDSTPAVSKEVSSDDGRPTKEELQKIAEDKSTETIKVSKGMSEPKVIPEKKPKFSVEMGGGKGFNPWSSDDTGFALSDYKTSPMINAKVGYAIWKNLELQVEYSHLSGFEKRTFFIDGANAVFKSKRNRAFTAFTANIRYSLPLNVKGISFSPYVVGGMGKVRLNNRGVLTKQWESYMRPTALYSVVYSEKWQTIGSGRNWKIGGGINIKLYKNLSLFSEYGYWKIKIGWNNTWRNSEGCSFKDSGSTTFAYSTVSGGLGFKF